MLVLIKQLSEKFNYSRREIIWFLEYFLNKKYSEFYFLKEIDFDKNLILKIFKILTKAAKTNIPMAYLIGTIDFFNLKISCKKPILIPRRETEYLVEKVIKLLKPYKNRIYNILDIGTGTGCIALALAKFFENSKVIGLDIDPLAVKLAKKNAKNNSIKNVKFLNSDLFSIFSKKNKYKDIKFDFIISNPPYIDSKFKNYCEKSVLLNESHIALFALDSGLELIKKIIVEAGKYLIKSDLPKNLFLEIDTFQKNLLKYFCLEKNLNCKILKDTFGKNRFCFLNI